MFKRSQRQHVKATVIAADVASLHGADMAKWDFVVDVRPEIGPVFRAPVSASFFAGGKAPRAGDIVEVSFDIKSGGDVRLELAGDARFDPQVAADESRARMKEALAAPAGTVIAATPQELQRAAQVAAMEYAVLRKGLESSGKAGIAEVTSVAEGDPHFPPLMGFDVNANVSDETSPARPAAFRVWVDPSKRPVSVGAKLPVRIDPQDATVIVLDHSR